MDINPLDIVIHIINIIVLFLILRTLVYKPVSKFMKNRTECIKNQLDDAAQKEIEAEKLREHYDAQLLSAEEDAKTKVIEITAKANKSAEEIIDNANTKADEIVDKANKKAKEEYDNTMSDMRDDITDVAVNMAKHILNREVTKEDNSKIIDSFFKEA